MSLQSLLRSFNIRTRMWGAIAMVLGLLALVAGGGLYGILSLQKSSDDFVQTTHQDLMTLSHLRGSLGDVRRFEKDLLLNLDDAQATAKYLPRWQQSVDDARRYARELKGNQDDEGSRTAAQIDQGLGTYAEAAAPVLKGITQQAFTLLGISLLLAVVVVVPLTLANMNSICTPIDQACRLAEKIAAGDLSERHAEVLGQDESARMLRALAAMNTSLNTIVGQVRVATDSITTASTEIAAGNQDLSIRTEQTASNLQQAASSIEQISGTVQHSADAARQANDMATSAAEVASRGGTVVSQVVHTMQDINDSSKKISDIIGVIDGIAFQTNILALNAAVEAARAGEQGRGFAVVASEVRSLAQRSAEAAREIKTLIGASVDKVEAGSRLVSEAGSTMNEIVASVERVSSIIHEITHASGEQSAGIREVNQSVATLDQMTQQNSALVEESAAAAESLRDQAHKLAQTVSTFRLSA
ncbi:MAG TPA: methyl-accepting chemotaxis protein [Aquabacterium sp.]|nr:methyl-accepting chemotaxis protein [Aquabacterium sp.]HRH29047.1 methyl-accepting chemotaxis protein [Aquabacterium sp.]